MLKILSKLFVVTIMAISITGCGDNGDAKANTGDVNAGDQGEVIELKLGHIQTENDFWHAGSLKFKEEVESKSDGKIQIKIYPNSTLGGDRDMAEGMQIGTIDFALVAGVLGNFENSIQLLELPYLFNTEEEFKRVIHGEIGDEIASRVVDASGIRILNWWDRGPRHVTSNKKIESLADIQGLKIRLPEIEAMVETWKEMGASPTTMAWNEVYTGLEQKVIEAQENPIPFIYGGAIHEVQDYLALTAHKYEYVTMAMSDKRWKTLTDDQQKILMDAAQVATDYQNELVRDQTEEILQKMVDEGLEVTQPDIDEFREAAVPAHEVFADKIDRDLYDRIIEEINNN